jgi:uncharacterized protein (TIGR02611 family)
MVRIARIGAGIGLIILGLFLLVLPGPGILTIAAGLAILAQDLVWARNILDWMKARYQQYFTKADESAPDEARDASLSDS